MASGTRLLTVVDLAESIIVPPEVRDAPVIDGPPPEGFEPAAMDITYGEPDFDPSEMSFSALHLPSLKTVAG